MTTIFLGKLFNLLLFEIAHFLTLEISVQIKVFFSHWLLMWYLGYFVICFKVSNLFYFNGWKLLHACHFLISFWVFNAYPILLGVLHLMFCSMPILACVRCVMTQEVMHACQSFRNYTQLIQSCASLAFCQHVILEPKAWQSGNIAFVRRCSTTICTFSRYS